MAIITGGNLGIGGSPIGVGTVGAYALTAATLTDKFLADDATRQKLGLPPRKGANGIRTYVDVPYSATRGILAPKDFKTLDEVLYFQFNPEDITDTKEVEWSTKSYVGFNTVDYYWVKGGERSLSFKLNFDATASSNTPLFGQVTSYGNPGYDTLDTVFPRGTMPSIDKIMAFQHPIVPQTTLTDRSGSPIPVPQFSSGDIIPSPRFLPPPVVVFVFGDLYMEGVIGGAEVRHTLFNEALFPIRSEVTVTFKMIQSQTVNRNSALTNLKKSAGGANLPTPKKTANLRPFLPEAVNNFL